MKLNRNKDKKPSKDKIEPRSENSEVIISEGKLDRIERKIDKLADSHIELYQEQSKLSVEAKLNRVSLEEHMRRTEALEKQVGVKYLFKIISGVSIVVTAIIKVIGLIKL